nr:MAG TPA: hypothetical protein [Bacteriophage sp.]
MSCSVETLNLLSYFLITDGLNYILLICRALR